MATRRYKRTVTAKVIQASRRNIRRAQMSRRGIRERRSVGRMTRSRQRFSKPPIASRAARVVRTRKRSR